MTAPRQGGEQGASLVIALVILTSLLVGVAAAATGVTASLRSGSVVTRQTSLLYAAGAGVDGVVQALRDDLAAPTRTVCVNPFTGPAGQGAEAVSYGSFGGLGEGVSVTATCQTRHGSASRDRSAPVTGPAIVTTATVASGSLVTRTGGTTSLVIEGLVALGGGVTTGDLPKPLTVKGDVVQQSSWAAGACTSGALATRVTVAVGAPAAPSCTPWSVADLAPRTVLPAEVPPSADAPWTKSGGSPGCTVYFPGHYGSGNRSFPSSISRDVYLASGTYYLDHVGQVRIRSSANVIGGAPGAGDDLGGLSACATDAEAAARAANPDRIESSGVTIVLGGSTTLLVEGGLVLRSVPLPSGAEVACSVYQARAGDADAGWRPWSGAGLAFDNGASTRAVVLNGALHTFDGRVSLAGARAASPVVRGGVVARSVTLKGATSGSGPQVLVGGPSGSSPVVAQRIVEIVANVTQAAVTRQATAIVSLSNTPPYAALVRGWRSE